MHAWASDSVFKPEFLHHCTMCSHLLVIIMFKFLVILIIMFEHAGNCYSSSTANIIINNIMHFSAALYASVDTRVDRCSQGTVEAAGSSVQGAAAIQSTHFLVLFLH